MSFINVNEDDGAKDASRVRLALQKSGRLSEKSRDLLKQAGVNSEWRQGRLDARSEDFPLDIMLVRDDDIPRYVAEGVCTLGVVGQNIIEESLGENAKDVIVLRPLDFGYCRLAIAAPTDRFINQPSDLSGLRIATSYPQTLRRYLEAQRITAQIVEISGSVEIAPAMGIADAICDLVSSGATLSSHGLREAMTLFHSQAVLIRTAKGQNNLKEITINRLLDRVAGVVRAQKTKYIMMNAPREALDKIRKLIPGLEEPTIMPLWPDSNRVAIHAVAPERIFWDTMEQLKGAGASSILVVPIEKIID